MNHQPLFRALVPIIFCCATFPSFSVAQDNTVAPLPSGVRAVWDLSRAHRTATATREQICLNGLWRFQPAQPAADSVPAGNWGHFKVPGCWPGITDYLQKDFQTLYPHPAWAGERPGNFSAAWYQREISIPQPWAGRRIAVAAEYVNSLAVVFVDGKKAGEIRFPDGEVDLTALCRPGGKYTLSVLVVALPLKGVMLAFNDTNSAREVKGRVARRGLCGDVFLVSTPPGPRISDVKVDTSVRKGEIALDTALTGVSANASYMLHAKITQSGRIAREFTSAPFKPADLKNGRFTVTEKWKPDALWDIHTPQNKYDISLSLREGSRELDAAFPVRFGFREFWIDGRDFYLNGTRIFLSSVPLDNAQVGAALATYEGARESLLRLKSFGINFVYTHNYGCEPGSHLGFTEILRAANDTGMLVALSQPHFSQYDWKSPDAERTNGYARHAEFYVRVAQNHPAVVAYSTSHNATGYGEDMNPDLIDGLSNPREQWGARNAAMAVRAEAIIQRLDPGRIVYHHSSGNLGSMHTMNFYLNFVPIQEMSDWFEHWATVGVKPAFMVEFGVPFSWDWTMYRGWYKGERSFGSAQVPWEYCVAEWNAQFLGDRAYQISAAEITNLRWEARQFAAGRVWHRWDYPHQVGSTIFDETYPVYDQYISANWPAFRTWGVSAISPWEHGRWWKLRDGVNKQRQPLPVDWDNLQRPGFSPDYRDQQYERFDLAFERGDWIPTAAAQALIRFNQPLLAYLAGEPDRFTSKDHIFLPGETVEKQLIVINNSRQTVSSDCEWSLALPKAIAGAKKIALPTGQQERVPLRFALPKNLAPGAYPLTAKVRFSTGETQADTFTIHVLPPPATAKSNARTALFDPQGETRALLQRLGVSFESVDANADLAKFDTLIVGKMALTTNGAAPNITRVRDGLKVVLFEQSADVLERRFGFRVTEYGLRQVFARVPDHPILAGLAPEHLRDWRGEATTTAPRLNYEMRPMHGPTIKWCDLPVSRLWRCGNRGNVASVLLEKPARGDFLPLLDGGYSLQYSPLLEYREGRGVLLFCQLDVTGRTENDPAADRLTANLLRYVAGWKPAPARKALYAGDIAGHRHLESTGLAFAPYTGGAPAPDQILILSYGAGNLLAENKDALTAWLKSGGKLLAIGFEQFDADALPAKVSLTKKEHIAAYFDAPGVTSLFRGIAPADVHNRDPRALPLVASGATPLGNGILASANDNMVFCQLAPWQFDAAKSMNLKRTHRRASFTLTRLLANLGVASRTPLLTRFNTPAEASEKRWLTGLYLDQPEEWDDPYRFFRW
ncbi:MAG: hypothetical protein AB1705_04365 [Verrucomicrobiota bacterium]